MLHYTNGSSGSSGSTSGKEYTRIWSAGLILLLGSTFSVRHCMVIHSSHNDIVNIVSPMIYVSYHSDIKVIVTNTKCHSTQFTTSSGRLGEEALLLLLYWCLSWILHHGIGHSIHYITCTSEQWCNAKLTQRLVQRLAQKSAQWETCRRSLISIAKTYSWCWHFKCLQSLSMTLTSMTIKWLLCPKIMALSLRT